MSTQDTRPDDTRFDPTKTYKAAVIGAGSGGLTVAIGLAGFGHDIALIEAGAIGGDCTNVGCIPSKALLHAAHAGVDDPFGHVRALRDDLNRREDDEMVEHDQIHLVRGRGKLTAPDGDVHVVEVTDTDGSVVLVRAEHVAVATGAVPVQFPIDGLDADRLLTNENLFDLREVPPTTVMVGGGPISLEMATAFRDLGGAVHIVELADRVMGNDDPLVSTTIQAALEARGVEFHIGTSIERFEGTTAHLANGTTIDDVDKVLLAIGRRPRLDGLGLHDAGVESTSHGIVADSWGKTSVDNVWAVGDVTGNTATTHGANSIARRTIRAIALPIPTVGGPRVQANAVYSRPEIASVGLSMDELAAYPTSGRKRYEVQLADIDRGYTDGVEHGVVMVDVERFTGKILRAAIVAPAAAEMIGMFTLMIDHGIGLRKVFGQVHPYPSYSQAIGKLADDFAGETYRSLPREWLGMARGKLTKRFA
jgi:pyruvate/2-oxoglutarate dehydrogenase complex dihydrolipoamide dehydrogenase (E3) component